MRTFGPPLIAVIALIGATAAALAQDTSPEAVAPPDGMMNEGDATRWATMTCPA